MILVSLVALRRGLAEDINVSVQKPEEGLSLHAIPFDGDEHPEEKKRRKRWVDFVSRTHAKWKPAKHTRICSQHFKAND